MLLPSNCKNSLQMQMKCAADPPQRAPTLGKYLAARTFYTLLRAGQLPQAILELVTKQRHRDCSASLDVWMYLTLPTAFPLPFLSSALLVPLRRAQKPA